MVQKGKSNSGRCIDCFEVMTSCLQVTVIKEKKRIILFSWVECVDFFLSSQKYRVVFFWFFMKTTF